jgi:hypothetical protein
MRRVTSSWRPLACRREEPKHGKAHARKLLTGNQAWAVASGKLLPGSSVIAIYPFWLPCSVWVCSSTAICT